MELAQQWIDEFLDMPHVELLRDGPVCPFVKPSMRAGTLVLKEVSVDPDISVDGLISIIMKMIESFAVIPWAASNKTLHALGIVLSGMRVERHILLDQAHALAKPMVVRKHLMLGQFHPQCPVPSARNDRFPVSSAPVPLLVLRNLALHDIMFLHEDAEWFRIYDSQFGTRFDRGFVTEPYLLRMFRQARVRWGTSTSAHLSPS